MILPPGKAHSEVLEVRTLIYDSFDGGSEVNLYLKASDPGAESHQIPPRQAFKIDFQYSAKEDGRSIPSLLLQFCTFKSSYYVPGRIRAELHSTVANDFTGVSCSQ